MSTVIYVRVSTTGQVLNGVSLENQIDRCNHYASMHQYAEPIVLADEGISGKSTNRPGFQSLLEMIKKKQVDNVIVYSLSRFARNIIDTVNTIEMMNKKGIGFHSITESIDTTSAVGRYFLFTLSALAQLEREQISERTKSVLQYKKSKGERIGSIPYGFSLAGDKKTLVENTEEQSVIQIIVESKLKQNFSYNDIISRLNSMKIKNRAGNDWHRSQVITLYKLHCQMNNK
jgi:site-specific DNA recombinase